MTEQGDHVCVAVEARDFPVYPFEGEDHIVDTEIAGQVLVVEAEETWEKEREKIVDEITWEKVFLYLILVDGGRFDLSRWEGLGVEQALETVWTNVRIMNSRCSNNDDDNAINLVHLTN